MIRRPSVSSSSLSSLALAALVVLAAGCAHTVSLTSDGTRARNATAYATQRRDRLEVDAYALPPPEVLSAEAYVVWGGERGVPPRNLGTLQFRTSEEARSGAGVLRTGSITAMPPVLFITAEPSASASSPTLPPLLWR